MERGFQTALWLLKPEIVFILGDIFDEGKWSSQKVTLFSLFCRTTVLMVMTMVVGEQCVDEKTGSLFYSHPKRKQNINSSWGVNNTDELLFICIVN